MNNNPEKSIFDITEKEKGMIRIQYKKALEILKHHAYITDPRYQFKRVTVPAAIQMIKAGDLMLLKTGAMIGKDKKGYFLLSYVEGQSDIYSIILN